MTPDVIGSHLFVSQRWSLPLSLLAVTPFNAGNPGMGGQKGWNSCVGIASSWLKRPDFRVYTFIYFPSNYLYLKLDIDCFFFCLF